MMGVPPELWPILNGFANPGRWPPSTDAEVDGFFGVAHRHYLLPLLMADVGVPPQIAARKPRYRALEALYRKRSELAERTSLMLGQILGVESFLFYKGADYRHRIYARPEFRSMGDIDIHVPAKEFAAAIRRLSAAGYSQKYSAFGDTFVPGYHEFKVEIAGMQVELHRSFGQRVRAGIDYNGMWQRRERYERDGMIAYRFSAADTVLCHAYNMAKDEFSPELNRYLDFRLLLQRYEDWLPECVSRAKQWGIERALFGAMHLTTQLFPSASSPMVSSAISQLLDPPTRRRLIERAFPNPATDPSGAPAGRQVQLLRKFMLMDRWWRRGAFVGYHLYASALGFAISWHARRYGRLGVVQRHAGHRQLQQGCIEP